MACRQIPIITAVERRCLGKEHNKQRKDEGSYFLTDLVVFSELLPQSQSLGCCGCASNIFQLPSVLPELFFLQEQMYDHVAQVLQNLCQWKRGRGFLYLSSCSQTAAFLHLSGDLLAIYDTAMIACTCPNIYCQEPTELQHAPGTGFKVFPK